MILSSDVSVVYHHLDHCFCNGVCIRGKSAHVYAAHRSRMPPPSVIHEMKPLFIALYPLKIMEHNSIL